MMLRIFLLIWLGCVSAATSAQPLPWEEAVYQDIGRQYGEAAEQRYRRLFQWISDHWDLDDTEKARRVNQLANNLPWIADRSKYNKEDYWATPLETITTIGGDCEDIALVKWALLNAMQVPSEKLRLAYVKIAETGESHMVLAYDPDPADADPSSPVFILDNLSTRMLDYRQRKDLRFVLTVSNEREVMVFRDTGESIELVKHKEDAKVKKIQDIQRRIAISRAYYQELNGGRPLF